MIRKAVILVLTLGASMAATIGVLSGSGCTSWSQPLWASGEFATTNSWSTTLFLGPSRLMVTQIEFLDAYAVPSQKRYSGPGWLYDRSVMLNEPSGLYIRHSMLIVAFFIPILLALLFSLYPAVLFIRGPLRRYRRRKKGLCVKCGYSLRGLPEPRCPECGGRI